MKKLFIATGSITYAFRGRDLLQNKGYRVTAKKIQNLVKSAGCGWGIVVENDFEGAVTLLRQNGIKILGVSEL